MRRVNGVALVARAIAAGSGATTTSAAAQARLLQAGIFSSCSRSGPGWLAGQFSDGFGQLSPFSGTMCFSNAASLAQDHLHHAAKGSTSFIKVSPKDVVLYQYEACPFCNKVKGKFHGP